MDSPSHGPKSAKDIFPKLFSTATKKIKKNKKRTVKPLIFNEFN